MGKKVVFCIPTMTRPYDVCLESLKNSVPLFEEAGWDHYLVSEIGCPYISSARATMLRKAMDAKADVVVFIDHDLSWKPSDLLRLVESPEHVTAGTYRFKDDRKETYMGMPMFGGNGKPIVHETLKGDIPRVQMFSIPAGFLKITKDAVNNFMGAYPELAFGDRFNPSIDLFNHGAHEGTWYGEDYAFSRRWNAKCGQIWLIPDLDLNHWANEHEYKGNYHEYLLAKGREQSK